MTAPILNEDLINRVLQRIVNDPAHWNQGDWASYTPTCGTSHCFAGWAVALTDVDVQPIWSYTNSDTGRKDASYARLSNGDEIDIEDYAAELLGLTTHEAASIFYCMGDSVSEIVRRINQIRKSRELPPISAPVPAAQSDLDLAGGPHA